MDKLGLTATDRITGFTGVVTAHCTYITGCNQLLIAPRAGTDGSLRDANWFDEQRLIIDAERDRVVLDNGSAPGFDKPAPVR